MDKTIKKFRKQYKSLCDLKIGTESLDKNPKGKKQTALNFKTFDGQRSESP